MTPQALLWLDADRVFDYVFEAPGLREVRGAAALCDRLNRLLTREIVEEAAGDQSIVFADGGSTLAIVPQEAAEAIVQRVQRAYHLATRAATVTGAWTPLSPGQELRGFGDAVALAGFALRRAKLDRIASAAYDDHPLMSRCDACARRPVQQRHPDASANQEGWLCAACLEKRREQERDPGTGPWMRLRWFAENAGDDVRMLRRVRPRDVDDIGMGAGAQGRLGFIYCDGNSFGQRMYGAASRDRVAQFSELINDLLEEVAFRTMLETVPVEVMHGAPCLPCEPILLGGDDIVLIAPATLAPKIALQLVERFERGYAERSNGERLHLSAAVVLAPPTAPLRRCAGIAANLLQLAKRRYQDMGGTTGTIDFAVLAHGYEDLASRTRPGLHQRADGDESLVLTQRPYAANRFGALLRDVDELSALRFPPPVLERVVEAASRSRVAAATEFRASVARCTPTQRMALTRAFAGQQSAGEPPWRREPSRGSSAYSTPALDLLELLPYGSETAHVAE